MEEAYEPPPVIQKKRYYAGDYINIPANLTHCYEQGHAQVGAPFRRVGRPLSHVPAMNTEIIEIKTGLQGVSNRKFDYVLVQNEDEEYILVRITDELLQANP